jgi:hypothetical protein
MPGCVLRGELSQPLRGHRRVNGPVERSLDLLLLFSPVDVAQTRRLRWYERVVWSASIVGYIGFGCVDASARWFTGCSTKECLGVLGLKRQSATTHLGGG